MTKEIKKKDKVMKKVMDWMTKKGFMNIKSVHLEEADDPSQFTRADASKTFVPDFTAVKTGSKNYIEIAQKTDNIRRIVTKWKLLSTMAAMKRGKLFLLAPRGHKAFTNDLVDKYNINAKIVSV